MYIYSLSGDISLLYCICGTNVESAGELCLLQYFSYVHFIGIGTLMFSLVPSVQRFHNKTVAPSFHSLLASYAGKLSVNQVTERTQESPPLFIFILLSYLLFARHVAARLFSLKVLYLSSPLRQPVTLVPRLTHISPAVLWWMFLAMKDAPSPFHPTPKLVYQRQHTANEEWILTTAVEREEGCGGGRVLYRLKV